MLSRHWGIEESAIRAVESIYSKHAFKTVDNRNVVVELEGAFYILTPGQLGVLARIKEALNKVREAVGEKRRCLECIGSALKSGLMPGLWVLARICIGGVPARDTRCRRCRVAEEAAPLFSKDFTKYAKLMASEDNLIKALLRALKPYVIEAPHADILKQSKLIHSYEIWPFRVSLLEGEVFTAYMCALCVNPEFWLLVDAVSARVLKKEEEEAMGSFCLDEILETRSEKAFSVLEELREQGFELPEDPCKLGKLVAFRSCGLDELYPPLLDGEVEEINILGAGRTTWIHHSETGGCIYTCRTYEAALHLASLVKLETGMSLDEERPYVKATIRTREFKARVSIDVPPIAVDGLTLSIRKFRVKPFTLAELIARGTLTAKAAAYLLWNLYHRRNITILGESGAGKTTLAVALDMLTPPWRKISIEEDAVESLDQKVFGVEHVRYLTLASRRREREAVLLNALHKSPVYVFLGEVLYPEDSRMLFHMLASGIKCIHTCHAEDVPQLLNKWRSYHGIPAESLLDLDLLVVMRKSVGRPVRRKVVKICEIEKKLYEGLIETIEVFTFNPVTQELEWKPASWGQVPSIRREVAGGYSLSAILEELSLYEKILERYALLGEHRLEDLRKELLKVREHALRKIKVEAEALP